MMPVDPEMQEIVDLFLEESSEGLDTMESGLLSLGVSIDGEAMNTIFRAAHSIKGGAATFGFQKVADFTHGVETLLDEMRSGRRPVTPDAVDALLAAVDVLRGHLRAIHDPQSTDLERSALIAARISALLADAGTAPAPARPVPAAKLQPPSHPSASPAGPSGTSPGWLIDLNPHPDILRTNNDPLRMFAELERLGDLRVHADVSAIPVLEALEPERCYLRWKLEITGAVDKRGLEEIFEWVEADSAITYTELPAPLGAAAAPAPVSRGPVPGDGASAPTSKLPADAGSMRVSTAKVDQLVNLVGELVITQSMLSRFTEGYAPTDFERLCDGLNQLTRNTRDLQESVMKIRMLQISHAFNRIPRIVHDLSNRLGKQVELKMSGEGTEIDKTVLEKISDPLIHLVRNALDHGLETPEVRRALGKPATGSIELAAYHEGGNIVVEIRDDGAGLNRQRILKRAHERGLVAEGAVLSEEEIHGLIFLPGFSTAETVSDVSGRGVGMDVVRSNIESLSGQVSIQSIEDRGSTIQIRLPLTLAILEGQLVRLGETIYVLSIISMIETLRAREEEIHLTPGGTHLFQVRGEYLPIVPLGQLFGVRSDSIEPHEGLIVIVEANGRRFGLVVDELLAQQQVVIKSLESNFQPVAGIAGATILADGTVALIIDVPGVVKTLLGDDRSRRTEPLASASAHALRAA
jgi:two-component system chemotaxis sensor kinase CheA